MGTASTNNNREGQKYSQLIVFNINNGASANPSTNASLSQSDNIINNIPLKEGDAPPPLANNPINSYNNDNNINNKLSIDIDGNKITINNSKNVVTNLSNEINNNKTIKINNKKEEKSFNKNKDINIGGDNKKNTNQENKGKSTEGNKESNIGEGKIIFETKNEDNAPKTTNNGDMNMFIGGKQRVSAKEENANNIYDKPKYNIDNNNENNEKIFTNTGNSIYDISKEKKENNDKKENNGKEEKTTVTPSPNGNADNKDINVANSNEIKKDKIYDVLSASRMINLDKESIKEELAKKRDEGYFPLFLKIDNDSPKFFFIKFDSTLRCLIKTYKMMKGIDDLKIEYTLYNDKNELLDQDIEINYLNISPLSVISNHQRFNKRK